MTSEEAIEQYEEVTVAIIDTLGEIDDEACAIRDALADYESADDLNGEEAIEAREDARNEAYEAYDALQTVFAKADHLRELAASIEGEPGAS